MWSTILNVLFISLYDNTSILELKMYAIFQFESILVRHRVRNVIDCQTIRNICSTVLRAPSAQNTNRTNKSELIQPTHFGGGGMLIFYVKSTINFRFTISTSLLSNAKRKWSKLINGYVALWIFARKKNNNKKYQNTCALLALYAAEL